MQLLIIYRFGEIKQPYKRLFIGKIKSVINYLPRCSYHLLCYEQKKSSLDAPQRNAKLECFTEQKLFQGLKVIQKVGTASKGSFINDITQIWTFTDPPSPSFTLKQLFYLHPYTCHGRRSAANSRLMLGFMEQDHQRA